MIIDECLTFFFAGSQTSSTTTQNLLMYAIKQPDIQDKIRDEVIREIIEPQRKEGKDLSKVNRVTELMTPENIQELSYFACCF